MLEFLIIIFLERNNVNVGSPDDYDVELGLLRGASQNPTTHEDESENRMRLLSPSNAIDHRPTVHEVIGEALVVFSRLLQTHN